MMTLSARKHAVESVKILTFLMLKSDAAGLLMA